MAYQGPTLNPERVLSDMQLAAENLGFTVETLGTIDSDRILWMEKLAAADTEYAATVFLSAGIHGDEPAAPLTILKLLQDEFFQKYSRFNWLISPLLNPSGFRLNKRENNRGIGLNRDFKHTSSGEVRSLKAKLASVRSINLALLLHEDWESTGFYLYDLVTNPKPSVAQAIISRVSMIAPIDTHDCIDEMPANGGIIRPDINLADTDPKLRKDWPEAFFLHHLGHAEFQYTLEAPSSLNMDKRIHALSTAIEAAIEMILS